MQLTVGEVRETQVDNHKTLQEIQQSQSQTNLTVEEIHLKNKEEQGKRQDGLDKVLENVQQTHSKTVDFGARTQEQYNVLTEGIEEVKKTVDTFKEGRDKDTDDKVLRNLVKSEFRGDIDYYVKRFQAGTREWVFDRVQNWLDDRLCQEGFPRLCKIS